MKNYNSRLEILENKLNPKTSLFKMYATKLNGKKELISEQTIPGHNGISFIVGRGIYSDEQIEEALKINETKLS